MERKHFYSVFKNTKAVASILSCLLFVSIVAVSDFYLAQAQEKLLQKQTIDASLSKEIQQKYANLPLYFIENQGQINSADVRYYLVGGGKQVFFTDKGVVFSLLKKEQKLEPEQEKEKQIKKEKEEEQVRRVVLKLEFINAQKTQPVGKDQQAAKINYFRGSDPAQWKHNIPTFASVLYPNLYKGIDMLWFSEKGNLKYQFIVHPGANPKKIQLAYKGIDSLAVSTTGELVIKTSLGEILEQKPFAYQEINGKQIEIPAKFKITKAKSGWLYGFEIGTYNHNYPLVIDPLIYSTFLGGADDQNFGGEYAFGIAVDSFGNAYVTGYTYCRDFPTTPDSFDTTYNDVDIFVSKLSPDGSTLIYSTFLGGTGEDRGFGLALDNAGNAYGNGGNEFFFVT